MGKRGAPNVGSAKRRKTRQNGQHHQLKQDPEKQEQQQKVVAASLVAEREALPIHPAKQKLLDALRSHTALVVVGETGSGKTTQLPQYLLDDAPIEQGLLIGITQPRRVAAITVAKRVAEERGVNLGEEVGYSVRFDDQTSPGTRLKFLTDGMLLREALLDPLLSSYGVIILDEAHERSLQSDLLFALLRQIQRKEKSEEGTKQKKGNRGERSGPLKIVIMSATLQAELFAKFFDAEVVYVQGRQHPVEVFYTAAPQSDYLDAAFVATLQVHLDQPAGDLLVFLTGREDIETLEKLLLNKRRNLPPGALDMQIVPIFSALPSELQMLAFAKTDTGSRKIILATNIAETSITIAGIRYVIDPGLAKARAYNPETGVDSLLVLPISKSAARQRSGRAGRDGPGKAYRLYTEGSYWDLADYAIPEIKRCRLDESLLQLKAIGVQDLAALEYFERPSLEGLKRGAQRLLLLGAFGKNGELTEIGKKMAGLPVDPRCARAMIAASERECLLEVLTIVAMLESDTIFYSPSGVAQQQKAQASRSQFAAEEGDHFVLLNIWRAYLRVAKKKREGWCRENFLNGRSLAKATDVRDQLIEYCENMGLWSDTSGEKCELSEELESEVSGEKKESICAAFIAGFFLQAAMLKGNSYVGVSDKKLEVHLHPTSSLFGRSPRPQCVIYNDLVLTTKLYMREVFVVNQMMLTSVAPHYFKHSTVSN